MRVVLTVEVDAAAWTAEFGVEPGSVRADVREHVATVVNAELDQLGVVARSQKPAG